MKKSRRRFRKKARAAATPPKQPAASAVPADPQALAQPPQDVDLKAAEDKIMAGLTPRNRDNVNRVVVAGMKVALKDGPNSIIAGISKSADPVRDCAIGAVNLAMLLRKESRDTMPVEALVPGAMILMLQAMDFADRVGVLEIGQAEIARGAKIFTNHLFNLAGITPQKFNMLAGRVGGITKDPSQMEALARRSGVVKDPNASQMTPLPGGLINGGGDVR